ncbi:MAG: hypothetical protein J6A74_00390 [Oscillospiraceae bacterium]|nr:hypothetical protein [Oscillospiraceae bacterium]
MKKQLLTKITNVVCAVLLVALFASFFLPSWDFTATVKVEGSRETKEVASNASVMEFTWMAYENKDLSKQFKKAGYEVNEIVVMPFVLTLCTIIFALFSIINIKGSWQSIFGVVGSGFAVFYLLTNTVLQQGPFWMVNLILACASLAASLVLLGIFVKLIIDWFTVKHRRL